MGFFTNIYGVLFKPGSTFRYFDTEYSLSLLFQALVAYFLAISIAYQLSTQEVISAFVSWFSALTIIFFLAYVFKLEGKDYLKLLCLSAFANLPLIFFGPIRILGELMPALASFLGFGLLVWAFNLNLIAIASVCRIRKRKVLILFMLPVVILVLLIIDLIFSSLAYIKAFL